MTLIGNGVAATFGLRAVAKFLRSHSAPDAAYSEWSAISFS
jgi:hypothetical protein